MELQLPGDIPWQQGGCYNMQVAKRMYRRKSVDGCCYIACWRQGACSYLCRVIEFPFANQLNYVTRCWVVMAKITRGSGLCDGKL